MARTTRATRRMGRLLEGMGGVGAEDERGLEGELVHRAGAAAVQVEGVDSLRGACRVLVGESEPEELRRPERDVGLDRLLETRGLQELRPVVPEAAGPAAPGLHLAAHVEAPAVLLPLLGLDDAGAGGVALRSELLDRVERLPRHRDERVEPAVRAVLVTPFPTQDRAGQMVGRLAARDCHAEL